MVKKDALVLFRAWKHSHRKFKVGGLAMFAVVVMDAVLSAERRGAIDALWQPDVLLLLAMAAIFYVFLAPIAMYIIHIDELRGLQRGRRDLEVVLADVIVYSALIFTLTYMFFGSSVMLLLP